jgi:hypothetical protein
MIAVRPFLAKWRNAALLSAALGLLVSNAARAAECLRWDVSGDWSAMQDNLSRADLSVTQGDTLIQGNATFTNQWTRHGNFDGKLTGSNLEFTVYWNVYNNGVNEIGEYTGTITPTGRIIGTTFDRYHPQARVAWYSSRQMACSHWSTAAAAPGPTPPPPGGSARPAMALGRVQPPGGAGSTPPMTICERARDAIARNSPVAGALERQCAAAGQ